MGRKTLLLLMIFLGVLLMSETAYAEWYDPLPNPFEFSKEEIKTNYTYNTVTTCTGKVCTATIGEFYPSNEIRIESQDYIDTYFDWSFTEINNTHWFANFTINQTLWSDIKHCRSLPLLQRPACWLNLKNTYFQDYSLANLTKDLLNFTDGVYPIRNLTERISFSDFKINLTEGKASFYIIFPEGFKINERAELGFGTTQINTGTNQGTSPEKRAICNSNTMKHVVYKYNTTHIFYANTSLSGTNAWTVNQSFYITSASQVYEPTLDCNGDTVVVGIPDTNLDDYIVRISNNNGVIWSAYSPITAGVNQEEMAIGVRGDRVYMLWYNDSADEYMDFMVINKTTGSVIIAQKTVLTLTTGTGTIAWMSMAINGTGDANDKVFIDFLDPDDNDIYFVNSTNGGTAFGGQVLIQAGTFIYPSIAYNNTNIFASYSSATAMGIEWSTIGATWTAYTLPNPTGSEIEGSVVINELNNPTVFTTSSQFNTNQDLAFSKLTSGATFDSYIYLTNDTFGNRFANTKMLYDNNKIEFIWRRGTVSPYQIWYDYISFTGEPNILGVPNIIPQIIYKLNASINCSTVYNGANNGRVEFIWYVNGTLQNYNGSTPNNVVNLTRVYTNVSLPNTTFVKNNNITCSARAYNGTAYSSWVNSSVITVINSPPTIVNQQSYTNQTNQFTITATVSDGDGLTDISSCLSFYKLDDSKQVDDFTTFHSPTNKSGTYTSGDGNCSVIINTSDKGQLRYGKDISIGTQNRRHALLADSNYIYTGEVDQNEYVYRLNVTNLTIINQTNLSRADDLKGEMCENSNYIFVSSQTDSGEDGGTFKINKADFSYASYAIGINSWMMSCSASDDWVFIGIDTSPKIQKWRLSDNTQNLTNASAGVPDSMFYNSTTDILYTGDNSGVLNKYNASNFTDVKWSLDKGTMIFYSIYESATSEGKWIWAGDTLDILYILNENDGATNRSYDYGAEIINDIVADNDYVYFISTDDNLRKLNKTQARVNNNFTPEWSINFGEDLNGLDIQGNYLYALTTSMGIWKIDKNSSQVIAVNDEVVTKIRFTDISGGTADTTGNSNVMPLGVDSTPPTYSLNSTNSTLVGTPIEFRLYWTDNVGLSKAITSLWNGSSWVNASSWCSLSGTGSWCNQTMTVNSTPQTLWWKQYANDSSNNWNTSENFSLITGAAANISLVNLTDAVRAFDYYVNKLSLRRYQLDSLAEKDSLSFLSYRRRFVLDSLAVKESYSPFSSRFLNLLDSLSVKDRLAISLVYLRYLAESAAIREAQSLRMIFGRAIGDFVGIKDMKSFNSYLQRFITDSAKIKDSTIQKTLRMISMYDSAKIKDGTSKLMLLHAYLSDSIDILESIYKHSGLNSFIISLSDVVRAIERQFLSWTGWMTTPSSYQVCSIMQQIGNSRAYLCVYDDGSWKVLIKGVGA